MIQYTLPKFSIRDLEVLESGFGYVGNIVSKLSGTEDSIEMEVLLLMLFEDGWIFSWKYVREMAKTMSNWRNLLKMRLHRKNVSSQDLV